ncbi:kinesin-like protein, putative [Bodo saltans]|uniref:Kinesin-like protein, putative n=1 Tax=Bodo saltans TaxID=75058 RepID=A0A0S4KIG4_BODSA|nr:kinesin-like protein, putative [Bodo saltans]|eukprot:CUI14305.1 kinesin-like protein, putative [Bodo saltans]
MALRPAGAHIRILTQYENFTLSANHAQVKLSRPDTGESTDFVNVSRVHRGVSTGDLFAEVVLPCVSNAFSGQSFTFLVAGPRDSGRSVTMYGNPNTHEKGILELTAEELLRAAPAHEATITRSHFIVEGDHIHDGLNGDRQVEVYDFPAPVGKLPLPTMVPLQRADEAVFAATSRSRHSSVFTQLHIYTTTTKGGNCTRRTLAIITFVDVCAITRRGEQMPRDFVALSSAVNCANSGQDARDSLNACRLTQLLEGSMLGGTTLVCICTVSGSPELFEDTKETLAFAAAVHKIQQVLILVHINTPKWVFDAAAHMDQVRASRQTLIANSYAYGAMECCMTQQKMIERTAVPPDDVFDAAVAEGKRARESIAQAISSQTTMLREAIQEQQFAKDASLKDVNTMEHAAQRAFDEAESLEHKAAGLEESVKNTLEDAQAHVDQLRAEVYDIKMKDGGRRADRVQYERLEIDCTQAARDYSEMNDIMHRVHWTKERVSAASHENVERRNKKRRLEQTLNEASVRVSASQVNQRQHEQIAAMRSRLSQYENNVCSLRSRSASMSTPSSSAAPAAAGSKSHHNYSQSSSSITNNENSYRSNLHTHKTPSNGSNTSNALLSARPFGTATAGNRKTAASSSSSLRSHQHHLDVSAELSLHPSDDSVFLDSVYRGSGSESTFQAPPMPAPTTARHRLIASASPANLHSNGKPMTNGARSPKVVIKNEQFVGRESAENQTIASLYLL